VRDCPGLWVSWGEPEAGDDPTGGAVEGRRGRLDRGVMKCGFGDTMGGAGAAAGIGICLDDETFASGV
jgi:hypothetical protein